MIAYLLKSGVCLLVSLVLYKCLLENEKMHRFNRFYLLSSLGVSMLAPLVPPDVLPGTIPFVPTTPPFVERGLAATVTTLGQVVAQPQANQSATNFWGITYWFISALLLIRFSRNLHVLFTKISRHPTVPRAGVTYVLLPENALPHAFLHYLFVNQKAYQNRTIEDELFTHELAHIRQRHSIDILLIELLTCFFWFNPMLIWFNRAIRLNYEFLADETVINQSSNVVSYQHLLLNKLTPVPPVFLTSTLTFQTTKQRFKMMTKQTSPAKKGAAAISAVLLLVMLTITVNTQTTAQVGSTPTKPTVAGKPGPKTDMDVAEMERRFGTKMVTLPNRDKYRRAPQKKFSELTAAEKRQVIYLAPEARETPTEAEFTAWKNAQKYGVWVNEKRIRNFANTLLTASDIVAYSGSYVHKNARQPEGYLYQMDLMTNQHYEAYLKESAESPFLILMVPNPKSR